ncbi:MAG TPA: tRNA (adenosine(37)-N6)-threonylcarbamoyltransferase complex ATPase subunit type 1 TsaE [Ferruginibacter sp.]|nr:tRNA (adenosine(37)-N6)-threonylcarbamoyltransferase complex ATPase subunit type 1 TsaE [Ferruginibacter sp.]HRO16889.1 tRNA (adenosine(37)-N6)-threonylcarbamoyltransferase complex ATPase subunit type 1 TsaE [Ferruginibacter sp.]HRQ21618.1 tRNA (adenosine(37)-N6)-threonylcarbamoyltransferase complex ATPase subunit type 1 TsaE [Ferruginibacter sp.]
MELIFNEAELTQAAEIFMHTLLPGHRVFAFHGPLGAGKTTFIQSVCKALKVSDRVSSPTFSIINAYHSPEYGAVYHMDLYRLKSSTEALDAGVDEAIQSGAICFIEWPDKAPEITIGSVPCFLQVLPGNKRKLEIKL